MGRDPRKVSDGAVIGAAMVAKAMEDIGHIASAYAPRKGQ